MYAIASLLAVLAVSLLVTRVATVVLAASGMSGESARFQARSAFTGAGFTTTESEAVVAHPLRRRVVMLLMLVGNVGFVAAASSLILGFHAAQRGPPGCASSSWPPA
jgi:Trk-type K+ transport system membrane component